MNFKKTVNISPPPKAHDRPYSKGWIELEGQITEELLLPALGNTEKNFFESAEVPCLLL